MEFVLKKSIVNRRIFVRAIALLILSIGVTVPLAWHNPHLFNSTYSLLTAMAYNTAICFALTGIGLLMLTLKKRAMLLACSSAILFISSVRLAEIMLNVDLHSSGWFSTLINPSLKTSVFMHPTTASNFILVAFALFLPALTLYKHVSQSSIWTLFLSLAIIASSLITFLGNGIGILPSFVWYGIKIASLTVLGFIAFSVALIIQLLPAAIDSFSRFNFFKRLIIGFGFMSILFIGIGSIAFMQINTVVTITHELHQSPLQINYAALRLKSEISQINRKMKDIAVEPQLIAQFDIESRLEQAHQTIKKEIQLINEKEPTLNNDLHTLENAFVKWQDFIRDSTDLLRRGDTDGFRERTLKQTQVDAIAMESLADQLTQKSHQRMLELNQSVIKAEQDAKNLLLLSIAGLMVMGLVVASVITRSLTVQLQKIRHAMLDIAHGNTETKIPFLDYQEEIGDMAHTLEIFSMNNAIRRRMEIRMSEIIEAAPNGIVMINREGLIEIFNRHAEKIFGYSRDMVLGQHVEKLIPARVAHSHPGLREAFFANPSPRAMGVGRELFGLRQDGSEFPLEIGLAPIDTEEGLMVLASIVDISERKKAEQVLKKHQEEVERSNVRLAQTNKELETFAYVASHDLKSPLRGIAQLSSWIEEDLAEKEFEGIDNHTRMLRNRIERMEKLLDDLLIFYRAGKIDGALATLDLSLMAKELFEIQNNKPGLKLVVEENLPVLTTLSTPFEQVLRNLFSNAIKHHDKTEGTIQISYRDLDRNFYEFSVCDDGPGIPKQFQERVFGMFQTLRPRDELEGSGMGLALIKKIVETYGGKIEVHSEGRGTCFRFTWPKEIKRKNSND